MCLLCLTFLSYAVHRYSLAPLTSVFAAMELGYTDAQKAYLLGAFFPGYIASQFPAGILSQLIGGKVMLTANLVGHALFMLLLPSAAALGYRWLEEGRAHPPEARRQRADSRRRRPRIQGRRTPEQPGGAVPLEHLRLVRPRPRLLLPACPSLKG